MKTKPNPKSRYRLRNWKEYNASLRRRGSLTLWLDQSSASAWIDTERATHHVRRRGHPHRGHPRTYSALAIECMLTVRAVYHLPLRATAGFVQSVLQLLGHAELPVADPSTLSRRAATLEMALPVTHLNEPLHLVVDSTGLKVYGEGEWKVKKHGWSYHRAWVKMHIGIDAGTLEIRTLGVSAPHVADGMMLPQLLEAERSPIAQVTGDGAYEGRRCYEAVASRPEQPLAVFPPPRERRRGQRPRPDAGHEHGNDHGHGHGRPDRVHRLTKEGVFQGYSLHIWKHGNCKGESLPLDRDEHVRRIRRVGRKRWKEEVHYHQRSLVETAIFRMKTLFGTSISSRKLSAQATEIFIRGAALNRMTALGMPDSYLATQM